MSGRALILAAGRGSRMGTETAAQPKCLTELAGRRLLEWQLAALHAAGCTEVRAVGGYRHEMLEPLVEVAWVNARWPETNMVATLTCAAPWLRRGPALISYADIVYHPSQCRALAAAPQDIAIAYDRDWHDLWAERFDDPLSDAESFAAQDGRLTAIGARPVCLDEVQGQYMGLLKLTPPGLAQIEAHLERLSPAQVDRLDVTALLQGLLGEGVGIGAVAVAGRWCEVDSPSDLALYRARIGEADAGAAAWSHDWRW